MLPTALASRLRAAICPVVCLPSWSFCLGLLSAAAQVNMLTNPGLENR